jgi:hypothetical protein
MIEMSTLPNMQLEELGQMSEEKIPGIEFDKESGQISFEYEKLDEDSQKTLDNLFAYLKAQEDEEKN